MGEDGLCVLNACIPGAEHTALHILSLRTGDMNEEWTHKELKGLNTVGLARKEEEECKEEILVADGDGSHMPS